LRLAEAHPDWVVGFAEETWWSRLARPALHPLRLEELQAEKDDPDPKALCGYGVLRADTDALWLRFGQGRPGEPGHRSLPGLSPANGWPPKGVRPSC
jgi:hypothetical protein